MATTQQQLPKWFTPQRLLCIFCFTNLMVYLDRGVISSNGVNGSPRSPVLPQGSGIQGGFDLTNLQDGLLATAFMVGLLIASPIFSESCKHYNAFKLIGIGMGTWMLAAFGCGLSVDFYSLIFCRMFVGVGEASFVALAAPFIDDYAPPGRKARWLSLFYLCIPVGFALGYIYGGVVAAALHWRAAFFIEALLMLPFVLFAFLAEPVRLAGSETCGRRHQPRHWRQVAAEFWADVQQVLSHRVWLCTCAAYTLYTAVLGVYAFWGPKAGKRIFAMADQSSDLVFGGLTVVTGVLGSAGGGMALDVMGSSLRNAALICASSCLIGLPLVLAAFLLARGFGTFVGLFAAGELALFLLQAPVAAISMWAVPSALRPLAISLSTLSIHLLGDVPSPPLLGLLETWLEQRAAPEQRDQQWRLSMSSVSLLLLAAGAVFLMAARMAVRARDYRKCGSGAAAAHGAGEEEEEEGLDQGPLLDGRQGLSDGGSRRSSGEGLPPGGGAAAAPAGSALL